MSYSVQNIRNVCLLGHSGSGKTALTESLLYMTGAIDRMGKAADGNTVCDYDPEEIKRQISISTSVAPLEYKGCKINILDAPGAFDFAGDVMEALTVADAAIIVCSAKDGISVGLEKAWKYCEERDMPRFIYISKTDEENSDYNATFDALRERFGNKIAPLVVPIWDENKRVTGIIDVLNKRAYEMQNGKRVEIDIPEGKDEVITEFNDALKESVAETSEEFMDKFFSGEDFTYVEMIQGLRQGVRELSLFPVLCGSAVTTMGSLMLMDNIVDLLPNPAEGNMRKGVSPDGTKEEFAVAPGGVPCAFVFKTVADQYGKYSYIKVLSGNITSDMALVDSRTGSSEKLGRLYQMRGKKAEEVKELSCGDIGAIGKMEKVKTGDTLCDSRKVIALAPIPFAEPNYSVAIVPKTRGQEDKVAQGLNRMNEEDPSFRVENNAETHGVQAEEPLQRGGGAEDPQSALPGEDPQDRLQAGPPQEADRRLRPVRRRVDPLRAQPRRGGDGVCRGGLRRLRAQELLPRRGEGPAGGLRPRALGGLSRGQPEGRAVRWKLPPGGLL